MPCRKVPRAVNSPQRAHHAGGVTGANKTLNNHLCHLSTARMEESAAWDPTFLERRDKKGESDVPATHDHHVTTEIMKLYNCRPGLCKYDEALEAGVVWEDGLGMAHGHGQVLKLFETMAMVLRPDTPDPEAPGMATQEFSVRPGQSSAESKSVLGQPSQAAGSAGGSAQPTVGQALSETIVLTKRYVRVLEGDEAQQAAQRTGPLVPGNIHANPRAFTLKRSVTVRLCVSHHKVTAVREEWEGAGAWRDEPTVQGAGDSRPTSTALPPWALDWAEARHRAGLELHPWVYRALVHVGRAREM